MRKMNEQEIRQTLWIRKWSTICTLTPGQTPYAIEATYFMPDKNHMNFMINPWGTTVGNILKNPHVLLKVTLADFDLSHWIGVSVFGIARMESSPERILQGWQLLGQVMNADYGRAAEKFVQASEKSPLLSVKIQELTGRCSAGPGKKIDFKMFD